MTLTLRRFIILVLLLLLALAAYLMRWDARALLWLQEWRGAPLAATSALWLPGYRAVTQLEVPGFEKEEFSGLAYDAQSDSLFAVSGKQPLLVELFPWTAPLVVAVAIGIRLDRRYGRRHAPAATPPAP